MFDPSNRGATHDATDEPDYHRPHDTVAPSSSPCTCAGEKASCGIAAGGFEPASAEAIVQPGDAAMVAFVRHFIANPDLLERIRNGWPLAAPDRATRHGGAARGYTDSPRHERLRRPGPSTSESRHKEPSGSEKP